MRTFQGHNRGSPMAFCRTITAKLLVWLAAILVPAGAMPLKACNCGNSASGAAKCGASASKCRCSSGRAKNGRACCSRSIANRKGCCAQKSTCGCCKDKSGSHGPCLCSLDKDAPAPAPAPNSSETETAKSLFVSACGMSTTLIPVVVPSQNLARAVLQPVFAGLTTLDRLGALCRLVI